MANYKKIVEYLDEQEPREFVKAVLCIEGGLREPKDERKIEELTEEYFRDDSTIPNLLDNDLHDDILDYHIRR